MILVDLHAFVARTPGGEWEAALLVPALDHAWIVGPPELRDYQPRAAADRR